jgi:two-component system response regulator AtoC
MYVRYEDRQEPAVRLELAVLAGDTFTVHPLPERGEVTLGRAKENDISIDDDSVSRRHAVLHVGPRLSIEDRGSANGTAVRTPSEASNTGDTKSLVRQPGQTFEVHIGDSILLGSTLLMVRRVAAERRVAAPSEGPSEGSDVVVIDEAMRALYEQADRAARTAFSVLVLGETGVGKEVLARAIHGRSARARQPFLPLNCAALPESLLESELFGHEKGAFTGAVAQKRGLFEAADGGTVFLDEVGELPMNIQVKLLRVLEDRQVLPVGGRSSRPVDVRFVSATNRDLDAEAERGTFRRDLFYRLNSLTLTIPPLRRRPAEIEPLARAFLASACHQIDRPRPLALSREAVLVLERYGWPGNVRELRNAVEHAVVFCTGDTLLPEHLPERVRAGDRAAPPAPRPAPPGGSGAELTLPGEPPSGPRVQTRGEEPGEESAEDLQRKVREHERRRILAALEQCAGNQTEAAKLLGISRRTLVTKLGTYDLPRPRKRS